MRPIRRCPIPDSSLKLGNTLGHYRLLEQIGAGGMGVVFRACDEHLERDVALKVLPPGSLADEPARRRFRKEALALSNFNHPNIAVVHDFDTQQGVDFLVMEHIPGSTLDEKLVAGPLPEKEVIRLGVQLAEGLAAAHAKGVIHRDLKPGNLKLTQDGRIKILDFGLAKLLRPASDTAITGSLSQTRGPVGTLPYMAPEQLQGEPVDARSDIWASGAVLYEMATGRRPFGQQETAPLIAAILRGSPPAPRELNPAISPGLEQIILKCLDCEPANRYQSAVEVAVDLRRLTAPGMVPQPRRAAPAGRLWRVGAPAALLLAAAIVLIVLRSGGWRRPWFSAHPRIESLAVLPLQNLSGDPQQEYFADGMTDELITKVAQTTDLKVTSRSSIAQYKNTTKSAPEIARELNVDGILEGSVERVGDRVRIRARLIYAPADQHLWARQYDRELKDVLEMQDEVARAIAGEVGSGSSEQAKNRLAAVRQVNPQAYDLYLHGVASANAFELRQAIDYFHQSISLQPDFAPAYAGLANAYFFIGLWGVEPPNQVFPKMEEAATKAIEKDPLLAEGHAALALAKLHYDWDFAAADREFRRALQLNASNADARHLYAHYLMAIGQQPESLAETKLALQLDPVGEVLGGCLAWHHLATRDYPHAIELSRKVLGARPDDAWSHMMLGWSYEQQKSMPEATAELQKALELSGGEDPQVQASLGHVLARSGRRREALALLEKMKMQAQKSYVSAYDMAVIHLGLGDKEAAIDWLRKASVERSGFLFYINWDPRFDVLRSDPRFLKILQHIGLPANPTGRPFASEAGRQARATLGS